jgi:hypothetical protein
MNIEQYKAQDYLPYGYYPWPNLINPHRSQVEQEYYHWIDTAYLDITKRQREKYKKQRVDLCAARIAPTCAYKQLRSCARFMLQFVTLDDQLEFSTREEAKQALDRAVEIFDGATPAPHENGSFQQMAVIRDECGELMPPEWMEQFSRELYRVSKYGAEEEGALKLRKRTPPLAYYLVLREYSVLMYPFFLWAAMETNFVLPEYIDEHPVMQRLLALGSRIIGWQNDFHSLLKEMGLTSEVVNLILVLQNEYNISLEEACAEAKRIHDADVAEFVALHEALPDFGVYQQKVYDYVASIGTAIQGVNSYYFDTPRYALGGSCFAWPEVEIAKEYRSQHFAEQ